MNIEKDALGGLAPDGVQEGKRGNHHLVILYAGGRRQSRRVSQQKMVHRTEPNHAYGELRMRQLYIALEGRKVGAIPMQVDVVEVAATTTSIDHLLQPV